MPIVDRYRRRVRGLEGRFVEAFGYELRDPFEQVCAMLAAGEPFAFSRFGDGELNAILGVEGENRDGHPYHPDLGLRLRGILESTPEYLLGLQPLAVMMHGIEPVLALSRGIRWVLADAFQFALADGRLGRLFEALAGREEVWLVGAPHHRQLAVRRSWRFVEVAYGDCWPQYEGLLARLRRELPREGAVFLFCAAMTADVLVDDLHRANPANTYVDVGCVFDPYVGVNSRGYHEELDPDALRV